VFIAGWYEFFNQGGLDIAGDNLRQAGGTAFWLEPELRLRRTLLRDISLQAALVNVSGDEYQTNIFAIPFSAGLSVGPVTISSALSLIRGETREISEGFAALAQTEASVQKIRSMGGRFLMDIDVGRRVVLTAEVDYASGDNDPRAGSAI
jgi:hypothetical protein